MKKLCFALLGIALASQIAFSQPGAPQPAGRSTFQHQLTQMVSPAAASAEPPAKRFDLDFPGGTPAALVAAIEKATGAPLNALVASEDRDVQIPPMKLKDISVTELFDAVKKVSSRIEWNRNSSAWEAYYSFETSGMGASAIWIFRSHDMPAMANECHFYQLGPYLDDYKVEDITTAIQTGWKMLGVKSTPELKFHPETKLLIAVGANGQLQTIDAVLQQLRIAPKPKGSAVPAKP